MRLTRVEGSYRSHTSSSLRGGKGRTGEGREGGRRNEGGEGSGREGSEGVRREERGKRGEGKSSLSWVANTTLVIT